MPMTAAMTIMPPVKLATDGASLKQSHPHATASCVSSVLNQRVLSGRDHLTTDGQENEPQTELRRPEQEQLE